MRPLRAAVVGAGWIAEHGHLPGYQRADIDVAGIADVVPERAAGLAARFGGQVYGDWREMLRRERPQIVSVCVPNVSHYEVAMEAVRAGAHVLCEKPIAITVAEAREMFDEARKQGVLLMAGQSQRFRPPNQKIKERIDAGDLGEVYHAEGIYTRRLGIPTWGSFTSRAASFGGALCDIGVHVIDLAVWFLGNPGPVSVSASTERRFGHQPDLAGMLREWDREKHPAEDFGGLRGVWDAAAFDVEDFATAYVRFASGATLYVQAAWAANIERGGRFIKLIGARGGATTDPVAVHTLVDGMPVDTVYDVPRSTGWEEEVCHFVDAVLGKTQLLVTEAETMNVQRILNGAYQSAASGREVDLSR